MQRRAAAVYFALLVLVGAGAYAFLQVGMAEPTVELSGPSYAEGDELTVDGRTFTVDALEVPEGEEEGEGGEAPSPEGTLTWFNDSARETVTLENDSTVGFRDGQYRVAVANDSTFGLEEEHNVSAVLAEDPDVEDEVAEQGDRRYVFYTNGTRQPLSEYLPEPDRAGPFAAGDDLEWPVENGTVTATVDAVSGDAAELSWPAPSEEEIDVEDGDNVTLAGVEHLVHFDGDDRVQILPAAEYYPSYAADQQRIEAFHERQAGFWGITILSFLGAIVLLASAYMPVRG